MAGIRVPISQSESNFDRASILGAGTTAALAIAAAASDQNARVSALDTSAVLAAIREQVAALDPLLQVAVDAVEGNPKAGCVRELRHSAVASIKALAEIVELSSSKEG